MRQPPNPADPGSPSECPAVPDTEGEIRTGVAAFFSLAFFIFFYLRITFFLIEASNQAVNI